MAFKVTNWIPEDSNLLAALGQLIVVHGHFEYCLRMTIKTITGKDIGSALRETEGKMVKDLKKSVKETVGNKHAAAKILEILQNSELITETRNELLHGFWCCTLDGVPKIRIERGKKPRHSTLRPVPTTSELEQFTKKLDQLTSELNLTRRLAGTPAPSGAR